MPTDALADLLAFYRRDLESPAAIKALKGLEISDPETIESFGMGWCSGNALKAASGEQKETYRQHGLIVRGAEIFFNCIVLPVYNDKDVIVDLYGIRQYATKGNARKYIVWQKSPQGLLGGSCLPVYPEIILADSPFLGLHIRQYGYPNVVSLRSPAEIKTHIPLLERSGVKRVYLCSRQNSKKIRPSLERAGVEVLVIPMPTHGKVPPKENFSMVGKSSTKKKSKVLLVARNESRLHFSMGDLVIHLESTAFSGLGMKCQVRVEREKAKIIDRLDFASAAGRAKFAHLAAGKLGMAAYELEECLDAIADQLDTLILEENQPNLRLPKALSKKEEAEARKLLAREDLLSVMADALTECFGIVGEEANRKLCVLITASRLLDKPLGCIIRGNPGSGKSSLIQAASKLLPACDVLYLSRLTPQALYFLPKDHLQHKLMVIDEYEGISDSEYSLRSMMSSQMLSLAITVRDGGRLPTTQLHEVPAKLALMVSSTQAVNIENLSRFLELTMDTSPEQTKRVMLSMASSGSGNLALLDMIRNANQLLQPCKVLVPFAEKLVFASASVLARRQFGQIIGLIQAHAALSQARRRCERVSERQTVVTADESDYKAVQALLPSIVRHSEEALSPFAMQLLNVLSGEGLRSATIKEVMQRLSCSYSKAYRALSELKHLGLVEPDRCINGVERSFLVAPYEVTAEAVCGLGE